MPENELSILIVDDEANIRKTLSICLEVEGHKVVSVSNFNDALIEAAQRVYDAAFVDLRLGVKNGLDLIPELLSKSPWLKIIVITAYASIETAVEAIKLGAIDYVPKPFTPAQIKIAVEKSIKMKSMEQKIESLKEDLNRINPEIVFSSLNPKMKHTITLAEQAADSEAIILLRGENGTGKTILAKAIHNWSRRAVKPFAVISCPSLSADLLESELFGHIKGAFTGALRDNIGRIASCEGGTLFLDEIGDIPISIQPKLLRFIQDREYESVGDHVTKKADVRILAATNRNLEEYVKEGKFREDLYYRLNVIQIEMPPLCEREEDIIQLAENMLAFFGRNNHRTYKGFTDDAKEYLRRYSWPGNIRELRNVVERASILTRTEWIDTKDLPDKIAPAPLPIKIGDIVSLEKIEEMHIRKVLASVKSLQEAADILGIDQATLWRKRKNYGI